MANVSRIKRSRFLEPSEVSYIRYGLGLDRDPTTIKRTLQSVCEHYEADRLLTDSSEVRQLIHSHLGSEHTLLRRWSIKALGLIKHPDDTHRLVERLQVERDAEAQTWGVAAILAGAHDRGLEEICQEAKLEKSNALILAARLYAPTSWIASYAADVRISLDDDELTLKWATFLIGYGKAPEELFHPRFKNDIFLGELNSHPSEDIQEYSIWGLWERPDYDASTLTLTLQNARQYPESVRKWLYRMAAQSPDLMRLDNDTFGALARDRSTSAREGLALGVRDLDPEIYGRRVVDWYSVESEARVRDILLSSMATQSRTNGDYRIAVAKKFEEEQPDSPLRRRLLAASLGTPLSTTLRKFEAQDSEAMRGLQLFQEYNVDLRGGKMMSGPSFNAGGNIDIKANNFVVGDMIASANHAVQDLSSDNADVKEILQQVLALVQQTDAPDEDKVEVASAAEAMAKNPTDQNRNGLIAKLLKYSSAVVQVGGLVTGITPLIESLQNLTI